MKTTLYGILASMLLLLTGSCGHEELVPDPRPNGDGEVTLSLSFATRAPEDDPERVLHSLRIIIFDSNPSGVERDAALINARYDIPEGATQVDVSEVVPAGYLNIYLIANEADWMNLQGIRNSEELGAIVIQHTSPGRNYISYPFLMYSVYKAVNIDSNGVITHSQAIKTAGKCSFPIERTSAKLSVNLDCDFADLGGRAITIDSARVVSMPAYSWLMAHEFTGRGEVDYFDSDLLEAGIDLHTGDYIEDIVVGSEIVGFETVGEGLTFYIPEHLIGYEDHSRYTWLNLVGHPLNSPTTRLNYRIPLGNGLGVDYDAAYLVENFASVPSSALSITRNTHYILDMSIEGLGETYGIEVDVAVEPWRGIYIDGTAESSYLNISTVTLSLDGTAPERVYFWSNRADVHIEELGRIGSSDGAEFVVNDMFANLAGPSPTNFYFNTATGIGYFDIGRSGSAQSGTRFLLYLAAGNLRREIEIFTD